MFPSMLSNGKGTCLQPQNDWIRLGIHANWCSRKGAKIVEPKNKQENAELLKWAKSSSGFANAPQKVHNYWLGLSPGK